MEACDDFSFLWTYLCTPIKRLNLLGLGVCQNSPKSLSPRYEEGTELRLLINHHKTTAVMLHTYEKEQSA